MRPRRYHPDNRMFGVGSARLLGGALGTLRPKRYMEIGSGFSSAVALDLKDEIRPDDPMLCTFIEPYADGLKTLLRTADYEHCTLLERPLQDVDLAVFDDLEPGDVLFIDSSHVAKRGSDLHREVFDILPRLPVGSYIHFHDISYPFDYPTSWMIDQNRSWNEAYFLRAFLMHNSSFEVYFWSDYWGLFGRDAARASGTDGLLPDGRAPCGCGGWRSQRRRPTRAPPNRATVRWVPLRRLVLTLVLLLAAGAPATASADQMDRPDPDAFPEEAVPGTVPPDTRPAAAAASQMQVFAATAASVNPNAIDDFRYDALKLEGRAADVCAGRLLQGSTWTFYEISGRFGGSPGTMYSCRERWDAANNPDCNGTVVDPGRSPNFTSTCWSNHAQGRAIDIMVGTSGGTYNRARGLSIVNWLLAPDGYGSVNANARKLGVQQILFADRCWNAEGDRGISSWNSMRPCGIGHFDHVHLDLTIAGANGQVSYWGSAPQIFPKYDSQVWWIWRTPYRQAISWWNLRAANQGQVVLPTGYDRGYAGDFDGDGRNDETFLWDNDTGNWMVQRWANGDSWNMRLGSWHRNFDEIIVLDLDFDGRTDDTISWDRDTNRYSTQSWSNYSPQVHRQGQFPTQYNQIFAGDFDGNGIVNDTLLRDSRTGNWAIYAWWDFTPFLKSTGHWGASWDLTIPGDWSAGGDIDELLIVDLQTGRYFVLPFADRRPQAAMFGTFDRTIYDFGVPGDYDADGRMDDVFLYDTATGQWSIYSFHRNVGTRRLSQDWGSYEQIVAGEFMY